MRPPIPQAPLTAPGDSRASPGYAGAEGGRGAAVLLSDGQEGRAT